MTAPTEDEIAARLRREVGALPTGAVTVQQAVQAGRRRARGRHLVAGASALAVSVVCAVVAGQLGGGAGQAVAPADRPRTVEAPVAPRVDEPPAPAPQPVYAALDARLAAMGLPTEVTWSTARGGGLGSPGEDALALVATGDRFVLTSSRFADDFDPAADFCAPVVAEGLALGGEAPECSATRTPDGGVLVRVGPADDPQLTYRYDGGAVIVNRQLQIVRGGQVTATADQLEELAQDPGLRWQ